MMRKVGEAQRCMQHRIPPAENRGGMGQPGSYRCQDGQRPVHITFRAVFMFPQPVRHDHKTLAPPREGGSWTVD